MPRFAVPVPRRACPWAADGPLPGARPAGAGLASAALSAGLRARRSRVPGRVVWAGSARFRGGRRWRVPLPPGRDPARRRPLPAA